MGKLKKIIAMSLAAITFLGTAIVPLTTYADDVTVYYTATGSKYHTYRGCKGLARAKNVYETTKSNAEARGLTACAICAGGTASSSGSSSSSSSSSGNSSSSSSSDSSETTRSGVASSAGGSESTSTSNTTSNSEGKIPRLPSYVTLTKGKKVKIYVTDTSGDVKWSIKKGKGKIKLTSSGKSATISGLKTGEAVVAAKVEGTTLKSNVVVVDPLSKKESFNKLKETTIKNGKKMGSGYYRISSKSVDKENGYILNGYCEWQEAQKVGDDDSHIEIVWDVMDSDNPSAGHIGMMLSIYEDYDNVAFTFYESKNEYSKDDHDRNLLFDSWTKRSAIKLGKKYKWNRIYYSQLNPNTSNEDFKSVANTFSDYASTLFLSACHGAEVDATKLGFSNIYKK